MGQLVNESHRIGQQNFFIASQVNISHRRIQRSKKHILFQYFLLFLMQIFVHHGIHKCRFPRIGIAYQGDLRYSGLFPPFALVLPLFRHFFQFPAQPGQPLFNLPSVQFQFLLAGSFAAHAPAGTALSRQGIMHAYQT